MKVTSTYLYSKINLLGFDNAIAIDCNERSGSLAILWKSEVDFSLLQFSNHHIHGKIFVGVEGELSYRKWHLIRVYGHPDTSRRNEVWNLFWSLKSSDDIPWLVLGDFNEVLSWSE